jgi:DNA mismatch endonuclease (patch repair protein)
VFVDGCFWHGCPTCYREPKTEIAYWSKKLQANLARDRTVDKRLSDLGWAVIRIWEHALREDPDGCTTRVQTALAIAAEESKN